VKLFNIENDSDKNLTTEVTEEHGKNGTHGICELKVSLVSSKFFFRIYIYFLFALAKSKPRSLIAISIIL
jgi:hypothetical protein